MFLYEKIFDDLRQKIINNTYKYGDLLPSEREIGKIYSVDRSTVRKAIQLLMDNSLVEKKPNKVTQIIYKVSDNNNLSKGGTLAFFLPSSSDSRDRITVPFYAELFYQTEQICKKHGYSLVYSTLNESDNISDIIEKSNSSIEGIMFLSNTATHHIEECIDLNLPAVLVNGCSNLIPCIRSDDFNGTFIATNNLINKGHTKIAFLSGISKYKNAKERFRGVTQALKESNINLPEEYILGGDFWEQKPAFHAVSSMLENVKELPTAIVSFNDRMAIGAIQAIVHHGLKVPEDISVIGFDNSDLSKNSIPPMDTVEVNIHLMAKSAFREMFFQLHFKESLPTCNVIPVELVLRDSSKSIV